MLFDHSPLIALVKAHYPVFGEFLDAVGSSIAEASFDAIRSSIAQRITRMRKGRENGSLPAMVLEEAASEIKPARFNWSRFDKGWRRRLRVEIARYRAEIPLAEARLEKMALKNQLADLESAARLLRGRQELLAKVAERIGSEPLRHRSEALREYLAKLIDLQQGWPALKNPGSAQRDRLDEIHAQIMQSLADYGPTTLQAWNSPAVLIDQFPDNVNAQFPFRSLPRAVLPPNRQQSFSPAAEIPFPSDSLDLPTINLWTGPLDGISFLQSYCDEKLLQLVAHPKSEAESASLRAIIGRRYTDYQIAWQSRQEAARAEIERQRIETNRRIRETIERDQRRAEETRRSEHPVEIP
ncbi:MAG TPA: hypothetical protein VGQ12_10945 [Candidatus Angelobacter sp.]|jgi:hypothetical protein|nr:hypothetical protein [Candidatus Angelobacter sp.]